MNTDFENLFSRTHHLTALTIERYTQGELCDEGAARLLDHTRACTPCRRSLESVAGVLSLAEARSRRFTRARVGALLAAAALVLLVVRLQSKTTSPEGAQVSLTDHYRSKGASFSVEVFVHDGSASRPVDIDTVVHPGDRLGFVASGRDDGHLLIVGTDNDGNRYHCHPADGTSEFVSPEARPWRYALPSAIRVDEKLGQEHILSVFCDASIQSGELAIALEQLAQGEPLTAIPKGCAHRVSLLTKEGSQP